jgi:hypothetical protein
VWADDSSGQSVLHIDTDPFQVFTPHLYPGNLGDFKRLIVEVTELSRVFHRQGVNIRGGNYSSCPKRKYGSEG